jgi:hypothetical protein
VSTQNSKKNVYDFSLRVDRAAIPVGPDHCADHPHPTAQLTTAFILGSTNRDTPVSHGGLAMPRDGASRSVESGSSPISNMSLVFRLDLASNPSGIGWCRTVNFVEAESEGVT